MQTTLKTLLSLTLIMVAFLAKAQNADSVKIKTSAICDMCKYTIEKDMAFEKGVTSAELDLDTKILYVVYNTKKTDPDKIRKRITLVGYHADDMKRDQTAYDKLPACCKDGAHADEH